MKQDVYLRKALPYAITHALGTSTLDCLMDEDAAVVAVLAPGNSREVMDFNLYMNAYDLWHDVFVDMVNAPTSGDCEGLYGTCTVSKFE